MTDVGEGRPRSAWRVEQSRDWGWCVRNGVFTKSGITGKSEEGYVAYRLKDKATAELIASAPARAQRLAEAMAVLRDCADTTRTNCPICVAFMREHDADCRLAAVLGNDGE